MYAFDIGFSMFLNMTPQLLGDVFQYWSFSFQNKAGDTKTIESSS